MFGLTIEEASGPPIEVWPDHVAAVNVFVAMDTQWRYGPNGRTGLDYGSLVTLWPMAGVTQADVEPAFQDIRVMEREVLELFRELREND